MKIGKKLLKTIVNPEETKRLEKAKSQLETAKTSYATTRENIQLYQSYYDGTKKITPISGTVAKDAIATRNIVYELIEAQVENSIPTAKVTAKNPEDEEAAKIIEDALVNFAKTLNLEILNDMSERDTPIKGGDLFMVEWDNKKGSHSSIGGISVTEIDPHNFIPQPGVTEIEKMDYYFIQQAMTKKTVFRKYGVDVDDAFEESPDVRGKSGNAEDTDIVTVNIKYYKTDDEKIGLYVWCDDYELYNDDDYQCRKLEVCKKCGLTKTGKTCECGSKSFEKQKQETETLYEEIKLNDGTVINPQEEYMSQSVDEQGNLVETPSYRNTQIPYYQPNMFNVVLRRNISAKNQFLGNSDVKLVIEQQDMINKLVSKMTEKILMAGSIVAMPEDSEIEKTDQEMRIVKVKPSDIGAIEVITLQGDISVDLRYQEECYQWARQRTGITDSFQGRYDSSAKSGVAKQYAINQAAGRLESKHVMKSSAYAKIYELIFKVWLSYADEPLTVMAENGSGDIEYKKLDRNMFLKQDANGEFYWNDEFIFETNPTSTLMTNKEALWQEATMKLQTGAFGPLGETPTLQLFWDFLDKTHYPIAGFMKKSIDARQEQETTQTQQIQQQQIQQEGSDPNAMSVM